VKSPFVQRLEYIGVKILLLKVRYLPKSWVYWFFGVVSHLFYRLSKRRRDITISNLQNSFGDMSRERVIGLSKDVYVEISKTITDILFLVSGRVDIDDMVTNRDEAIARLRELESSYDNGFIFMGAHFSNWELPPLFASKYGFPMVVIGREGDNRLIDHNIVIPFRSKYGNRAVYKKRAGIAMVKELKAGGAVGALIDQKVNKANGFLVKFFGREAFTTHSIAMSKLRLNPAIIPISMPRVANGKYRLDIGDPIEYIADEISDHDEKLLKMTEVYNQKLEEIIRAYPTQWFWMHDRWNQRV
jgi:KDO2-lipid IV(A) lauroyltransferase